MINQVTVFCTQCRQNSDLFLSSEAQIIIFNCPACWTPLLHYRGTVHVLTEYQFEDIQRGNLYSVIGSILQKTGMSITKRGAGIKDEYDDDTDEPPVVPSGFTSVCVPSVPVSGCRSQVISYDDILNLHIDLANTRDIREFLAHIG